MRIVFLIFAMCGSLILLQVFSIVSTIPKLRNAKSTASVRSAAKFLARSRSLSHYRSPSVALSLDLALSATPALPQSLYRSLSRAISLSQSLLLSLTSNDFVETLLEQLFRPSLSTIILENSKYTVLMTTKKMEEMVVGYAVVIVDNKLCGILTSKDILMRVIAQNLSPKTTIVENVMTSNLECATIDTPVCDVLIKMHERKCGNMVAVVDVVDITHAVVAYVKMTDG
ncbi:unnamed protein product [Prunus armeniaca]|uniref:CBS domain-containing protein n=1 Tax=Prunus armeniaca TaxID=36596 RepID=A0A6J5X7U8_PRUAR|nr:unnamed protein product [Prunus armeniaca]